MHQHRYVLHGTSRLYLAQLDSVSSMYVVKYQSTVAESVTLADKLCLIHTSMSSNTFYAACRERRPVIDRVAAELLDGGPMEMVEGTRIVELLLAMPPVASQTPLDSLREVPLLLSPFACSLTSSSAAWAVASSSMFSLMHSSANAYLSGITGENGVVHPCRCALPCVIQYPEKAPILCVQ